MPEATDAELVGRAAQGDREAFTELVCRYKGSITALIRRLVVDPHEREDLLQEALLQSWLSIGCVRNTDRVHAWLLKIARSRCIDWLRSPARAQSPADQNDLETYINRYGRANALDSKCAALADALHDLPPPERRTVELFYLQGLTVKEVGTITQSPVNTVKSRLFCARHHLRSILEEEGESQ